MVFSKKEAKVLKTLGKKAGKAILYEEFSTVGAGENSLWRLVIFLEKIFLERCVAKDNPQYHDKWSLVFQSDQWGIL